MYVGRRVRTGVTGPRPNGRASAAALGYAGEGPSVPTTITLNDLVEAIADAVIQAQDQVEMNSVPFFAALLP